MLQREVASWGPKNKQKGGGEENTANGTAKLYCTAGNTSYRDYIVPLVPARLPLSHHSDPTMVWVWRADGEKG